MGRSVLLLMVILVSWAALCSAAGKEQKIDGEVTGVVITEDGSPAGNFKVCTQVHLHQSVAEGTLTCCPTTTDHDGQFTIEHLNVSTAFRGEIGSEISFNPSGFKICHKIRCIVYQRAAKDGSGAACSSALL